MTIQVNGQDILDIAQSVAWGASILGTASVVLIVYLIVRPSRRAGGRPPAPPAALDADEIEDLWRLVDRMEARIDVLERALSDQLDRPAIGRRDGEEIFAPAEAGRDSGRTE
jgi:hypothetical protein